MHVYNLESQAKRDRLKWRMQMTKQTVSFGILVGRMVKNLKCIEKAWFPVS